MLAGHVNKKINKKYPFLPRAHGLLSDNIRFNDIYDSLLFNLYLQLEAGGKPWKYVRRGWGVCVTRFICSFRKITISS